MAKLKLGKLPDRKMMTLTFTTTIQLCQLLEECVKVYEQTYSATEKVENLVPFIKNDQNFRKANNETASSRNLEKSNN